MNEYKKSIDTWKKNNKDKIKKYNQEYYKRKKHIILYNKKAREETESILISETPKKTSKPKINKNRQIYIELNLKRKKNG